MLCECHSWDSDDIFWTSSLLLKHSLCHRFTHRSVPKKYFRILVNNGIIKVLIICIDSYRKSSEV